MDIDFFLSFDSKVFGRKRISEIVSFFHGESHELVMKKISSAFRSIFNFSPLIHLSSVETLTGLK